MACSGACCENFTLVVDGKPVTHAEWRASNWAVGDLGRLAYPAADETRFNCVNYDPRSHLCKDYDNRPQTCRDYPRQTLQQGKVTDKCQHCGDCGG